MKPNFPLLLVLLLAASPSAFAQSQQMIPPEMAARFVGKDGMVCGKVEKAKYAQNSEGEPTFLYMGGMFPRHTFSARIAGADRGKFGFPPETLEGKDVCVIGKIERDSSRAEIQVSAPSSLKLATIK
ncbi:hypothetical protein FZ025_19050 [Xanthomonas hyacinthi]|uniref:Secreted protein n=1 Tax=Xanthomonas hyacinthi TaxID=56455 RepID=A0A2S7EVP4_9XANT|nr:hypothetical protein [Xanthomonas hyacinthi]KLD74482.1 hypothetical protein Y886_32315 [Xanthomonas hyacinthi DSM 19077]PPU97192.1 hypothetical protein XhyaCFBP1156_12630 [Xanthomonas hyacinthi]QGY78630.1 hypothetical protein FZ025_19050 [Xanthomonas hyacinthi]